MENQPPVPPQPPEPPEPPAPPPAPVYPEWAGPPPVPPAGPPATPKMPQVVVWYYIYAGVLGLLALIGLIMTPFSGRTMMEMFTQMPEAESIRPFLGLILVVTTVIRLVVLFGAIAAFALPRTPWVWIYHLVYIIVTAILNCCCIPFAIPLIIFWVKPATQRWYGRNP